MDSKVQAVLKRLHERGLSAKDLEFVKTMIVFKLAFQGVGFCYDGTSLGLELPTHAGIQRAIDDAYVYSFHADTYHQYAQMLFLAAVMHHKDQKGRLSIKDQASTRLAYQINANAAYIVGAFLEDGFSDLVNGHALNIFDKYLSTNEFALSFLEGKIKVQAQLRIEASSTFNQNPPIELPVEIEFDRNIQPSEIIGMVDPQKDCEVSTRFPGIVDIVKRLPVEGPGADFQFLFPQILFSKRPDKNIFYALAQRTPGNDLNNDWLATLTVEKIQGDLTQVPGL